MIGPKGSQAVMMILQLGYLVFPSYYGSISTVPIFFRNEASIFTQ